MNFGQQIIIFGRPTNNISFSSWFQVLNLSWNTSKVGIILNLNLFLRSKKFSKVK